MRGLAALAVATGHFLSGYDLVAQNSGFMRSPLAALIDGKAAVAMFFVLSGLALSLKYFRSNIPEIDGRAYFAFVVSRWCRIAIPYLVLLLATWVAHRSWFVRSDRTISAGIGSVTWTEISTPYWLMRQSILFNPVHFVEIPQAWTLSVEIILSMFVPAAVLVARRSSGWLLLTAGLLWIASPEPGIFGFGLHFILGILLAKHGSEIHRRLNGRPATTLGLLLVGLFLYTAKNVLYRDSAAAPGWGMHLSALGSVLLLAGIGASGICCRALNIAPLRHIGRISYSIYLIHLTVLMCITPQILAGCARVGVDHGILYWGSGLAGTMVIVLVISEICYRLVELPAISIGRRLSSHVAGWDVF